MIDIRKDRLNYGNLLVPPYGFVLNKAITTTYSLDFEILTASCMALGINEPTDSLLANNKLCVFEAIKNVADKLVIFYEAGQVSIPNHLSKLHILFEKCMVPVALPKKPRSAIFPSFHPKCWILEYVNSDTKERKYKLLVMSRNLSADHSWDVAAMLEGRTVAGGKRKVQPLLNFIDFLKGFLHTKNPDKKRQKLLIDELRQNLETVKFDVSADLKPFSDFEILPLGIENKSYAINKDVLFNGTSVHDLVVVSPFLSASVISLLNNNENVLKDKQQRILITRRAELEKLRGCTSNFEVYVMKDCIIDGENNLPEGNNGIYPRPNDIHAKFYLWRKYSDTYLYLGSMNASERGTGIYPIESDAEVKAVNVELMLKLRTQNRYFNLDRFREEVIGNEKESTFEKISIEELPKVTHKTDNQDILLQRIKQVCHLDYRAEIEENEGIFNVVVKTNGQEIPDGITLAPAFLQGQELTLTQEMNFKVQTADDLSELYCIQATDNEYTVRKLMLIPTKNLPIDREDNLIKQIIHSRKDFYDYVAFLLGDDYLSTWSNLNDEKKMHSTDDKDSPKILTSLYERMIRVACQNPQKLKGIEDLTRQIDDKNIIPDEFRTMYRTFKEALKLCTKKKN